MWGAAPYHYGMSALFKPISSELGFSRAATSVPTAIGRLEGGFEAPLAGWITDKFGPKWIVLFGVFLIGLSLILMNFVNSLWAFYVVWGVLLGTGTNIGMSIPIDKAITDWFVKKRGKALGIKWVGSGLSGVLVLPLLAWLITIQGWRMASVIFGVIMWALGLPLAWFSLKRHRPEYYGLLPDGATAEEKMDTSRMIDTGVKYATEVEEVEFTLRQSMRTSAFWMMVAAQAVHGLTAGALNVHLIPFLTDRGMDPLRAAGMMAVMVSFSIPARFIGGFLADRINKSHIRFLMAGAYFSQALGFAVFLLNQSIPMIYVWLALYGAGQGVGFLFAAMTARYFGRKAFGSIQGTKQMLMTPFSIVAPIYLGWVYDTTGSYMTAFGVVAAVLTAASVLMSFARPPKPPAQIADIRKLM